MVAIVCDTIINYHANNISHIYLVNGFSRSMNEATEPYIL